MKLYYSKGACSLASRILLNEMGFKSEFESVDLATKQTETGKDYKKINPKGSVPALLLDNGELLTENAVIHQYLADTAKATALLPPVGDFNRYRVLQWTNYIATDMHKTVGILFNTSVPEETKEKVIKPLIKTKLSYIDQQLNGKKYLLGNQFTLPDAYLFVILNWANYFKFDIKEWPNIYKYFMELNKIPSIRKSLEEESIRIAVA